MGAGDNNGKNYGGGHTGRGDYKKGGRYSSNGLCNPRLSHRDFTEGMRVSVFNKGRPVEAVVAPRPIKERRDRPWIPLYYTGNTNYVYYAHKNSIRPMKKCNIDNNYNTGDKVVYTGKRLKKGLTRNGVIVDKPAIKQIYNSFVQVIFYDNKKNAVPYYIHKNLVYHIS